MRPTSYNASSGNDRPGTMDDLTEKTVLQHLPQGMNPNFDALHKLFPSSAYLRARVEARAALLV